MHTKINLSEFRQAFHDMGRGDQFTYEGLEALFDSFEQYEQATDEPIELDVIAFCCEFAEETPAAIARDYRIDVSACEDDEEVREVVLDYLDYHTFVCGETDTTIVYQQF